MLLLQDGVLAFLSAVGLTTTVWVFAGALLHAGGRPAIPGLLLVLPLKGEALAMEADVRELRRVQGSLPHAAGYLTADGAEVSLSPSGGDAGGVNSGLFLCIRRMTQGRDGPALGEIKLCAAAFRAVVAVRLSSLQYTSGFRF